MPLMPAGCNSTTAGCVNEKLSIFAPDRASDNLLERRSQCNTIVDCRHGIDHHLDSVVRWADPEVPSGLVRSQIGDGFL